MLVCPYRRIQVDRFENALLKRADAGYWQALAGGGNDEETPLAAARREAFEEAGVSSDSDLLQLDTVASIPVTQFRDSHLWGDNVYVIPQSAVLWRVGQSTVDCVCA